MELPDRYWDTEQQRWIYPGDLPPLPEPKFPINSATRWSDEEMRSYGESCARMAREEERERCIQACEDERVAAEETGRREDFAYNNAIANCVEAIRKG